MSSNRKQRERKYNNGFGPQHFPNGTVFEVNEDVVEKTYDTGERVLGQSIFTVQGIVRNGFQSYVLKTGVMQKLGESDHDRSFNISHVKRIISRGTGKVVIDHNWYGESGKPQKRTELERFAIVQPIEGYVRPGVRPVAVPQKGYYLTFSVRDTLAYEVSRMAKPGQLFNLGKIIMAVTDQSWTRTISSGWLSAHRVNKKRLRRFLKANANRFLCNLTAETVKYDDEVDKAMNEDFDYEYAKLHPEEEHPEDPGKVTEYLEAEGSHYDNNDLSYTDPAWNESEGHGA